MRFDRWLSALLFPLLVACGEGGDGSGNGRGNGQGYDLPAAGTQVSEDVQKDLAYLREEEKLARDVYTTLHDAWQSQVFENIASSEQTHADRVAAVLGALALPDPVKDDTTGVFQDVALGELYKELTGKGKVSEVAAFRVGATVEELDIHDIKQMKARAEDPAIFATYEALECGSRNHLRAFVSNLSQRGESYQPLYLGAEELGTILAGDRESCGK
jgi:hypothetical protein